MRGCVLRALTRTWLAHRPRCRCHPVGRTHTATVDVATDNNDLTTPTYRSARHSESLPHAHPTFLTKYRPPVFTDAMLTFTKNTMRGVCADLDTELIEANGEADHVRLLAANPPTLAICAVVQRLKGRTADAVRPEHTGVCDRARIRGQLWSPSHFTVPCRGAPLSIINQHIDRQARPH
jgi:putative transposase